MTIYGIKNCSTVSKARKFMRENGIEFDFVDYKVESVDETKIREWLKHIDISALLNTRGVTYKKLKLKNLDLDDDGKISWMAKENNLLKRPVIEYGDNNALVSYDEEVYKTTFL